MESHQDALAVIEAAREHPQPWGSIALTLSRLQEESQTDSGGKPWTYVVSEATGWTVHQLNQMLRALATIKAAHARDPAIDVTGALEAPYTSMEIVSRIARISPVEGERLVRAAAGGDLPILRKLRSIHQELVATNGGPANVRSAGQVNGRLFRSACLDAFDDVATLRASVGAEARSGLRMMPWPRGFDYASPTFVALERCRETVRVHAMGCVGLRDKSQYAPLMTAVRAAGFESTFFDSYVMVLGNASRDEVAETRKRLEDLGLCSVGLSVLTEEGIRVVMRPVGLPSPDRRPILRAHWTAIGAYEESLKSDTDVPQHPRP